VKLSDLLPVPVTNIVERERRSDRGLLLDVPLRVFTRLLFYLLGFAFAGGFR
jgi:hypothetical protein